MADIRLVCWLVNRHQFGRLYSRAGWIFAFVLSLPGAYIAPIHSDTDGIGNILHLRDGVAS